MTRYYNDVRKYKTAECWYFGVTTKGVTRALHYHVTPVCTHPYGLTSPLQKQNNKATQRPWHEATTADVTWYTGSHDVPGSGRNGVTMYWRPSSGISMRVARTALPVRLEDAGTLS